jgi:hypothetical protein
MQIEANVHELHSSIRAIRAAVRQRREVEEVRATFGLTGAIAIGVYCV